MSQFLLFVERDIYRHLYKHSPFVVEILGQVAVFAAKMIYVMYHLLPSNPFLKKKEKPKP